MANWNPLDRVARLKRARPARAPDGDSRIPPGQYETRKFPVLTFGEAPAVDRAAWRLRVWGLVEKPVQLTWEQLLALPRRTIRADIHCVTRWTKLDTTWEGVPFREVLAIAEPLPEVRFVMQHSYGGYTTNLPLEELLRPEVLLADTYDGAPLPRDHGGPLRLVVPHLYFWKSAKWLCGLELMAQDRPGFWEQYGYHEHGDPWKEERFGSGVGGGR